MKKDLDKLMSKPNNVHEGHRQRLRAKVRKDPELETLADHEALEFHLSLVIPRKDTNELAHDLINTFGSLDGVLTASPDELIRIKNMTVGAAYLLSSEYSLVRKAMRSSDPKKRKRNMGDPVSAIEYMQPYFVGRKTECSCVALLDINYKTIDVFFNGGGSGSQVDINVTDITQKAMRAGASYVIVAHNHPTGNVTPSVDDITSTCLLFEILYSAGIELADHVIFHDYDSFSFHNNGLLDKFNADFLKNHNNFKEMSNDEKRRYVMQFNEYVLDSERIYHGDIVTKPVNQNTSADDEDYDDDIIF